MDIGRLRSLCRAKPFKAFHLLMDDGRSLPVDEPTYLAVSPDNGSLVYAPVAGGYEWVQCQNIRGTDHYVTVAKVAKDRDIASLLRRERSGGSSPRYMLRAIGDLLESRPFRPVAVLLADGRKVMTVDPQQVLMSPGSDVLLILGSAGRVELINPAMIASVCVETSKESGSHNE